MEILNNKSIWLKINEDKIIIKSFAINCEIVNNKLKEYLINKINKAKHTPVNFNEISSINDPYLNQFINKLTNELVGKIYKEPIKSFKPTEVVNLLGNKHFSDEEVVSMLVKIPEERYITLIYPSINKIVVITGKVNEVINLYKKTIYQNKSLINKDYYLFNIESLIKFTINVERDSNMANMYLIDHKAKERIVKLNYISDCTDIVNDEFKVTNENLFNIKNYHIPVKNIKKFINETQYIFSNYGYDNMIQIPFKVSVITYRSVNETKNIYLCNQHPLKGLFNTFKLGLSSWLKDNEKNSEQEWVCCSSIDELYIKGMMPLIFNYYYRNNKECIVMSECEVNESFSEISKVILTVINDSFKKNKINIKISQIKNYNLYNVVFMENGKRLFYDYGSNLKLIINTMLINYYGLRFQNNIEINEEIFTYSSDFDGIYNKSSQNESIKEIINELLGNSDFKIACFPWKYNDILKETYTKCFKCILIENKKVEEV